MNDTHGPLERINGPDETPTADVDTLRARIRGLEAEVTDRTWERDSVLALLRETRNITTRWYRHKVHAHNAMHAVAEIRRLLIHPNANKTLWLETLQSTGEEPRPADHQGPGHADPF